MFVHGCFWHRHEGCRFASTPKSRVAFWTEKFVANVDRDARQEAALRTLGWRVLVIWECETKDKTTVERRLAALIRRDRTAPEHESTLSVAIVEHLASTQGVEAPMRRPFAGGVMKSGLWVENAEELGFSEQTGPTVVGR